MWIIERLKSDEEKEDEEEEEEEETATPQLTQLQEFEFDEDVIFVSVELQSEEKIEIAKHYLLPHSFYNYDTKPPCPGFRLPMTLIQVTEMLEREEKRKERTQEK